MRTPTTRAGRNSLTRRQILTLLQKNKDSLRQYSVKRIGLFGSYAKGEHNRSSDIDLLVEFRRPTLDNFMGLIDYLEKLFGRKVDVLTPGGVDSIRVKGVAENIKKSVVYA